MQIKVVISRILLSSGDENEFYVDFHHKDTAPKILSNLLKERYELIFDPNGKVKGFANLFYNNAIFDNINDITLSDKCEIELLASISGG